MSQLRHEKQTLESLNVNVCIVTFAANTLAMAYVKETHLEWPLLIDHDRSLYRAYGMESGTPWNLYGPSSIRIYLKLMAHGRRLRMPKSDVRQLGGDVLIDPAGVVRLHHVGNGPADRPSLTELLDCIRSS